MSGPVTDPKLIAQLEANQASGDDAIVSALIDGRMSFPTDSRALNKPYWQGLIQKVSAKDPTFDTIDYKSRARTRQDFTSGKSAQNITSFNTLLHHIGTLQKAADDLDNFGGAGTLLNRPTNALLEAGGSARPTNFRQAKLAVVGEAVRAFRGVGGARGDIEEAADAIPENGSPEQIRGSIKTLASLLEGRIKSLGEQYSAGMGKTSDGINLLDDDAQKTLASLGIGQQAKGGDRDSGAAGVVADGSGTPPSSPPNGGGELRFGDQMDDVSAKPVNLSPEQEQALQAVAQNGGSAQQIMALANSFGGQLTQENAEKLAAFYADPAHRNVAPRINVDNTVKPVDAGDGVLGAGARGAGNTLTLGFLDEAGALADTVTRGGTYADNLDTRRGQELFDEQQHGVARFAGQAVGAIPLGGVEVVGARVAAREAGIAALRAGETPAVARAIANRTLATRSALNAAVQGGAYGFGDTDGGLGDRLGGAAIGAGTGAALGGALAYGGSRFARAMASRTAARPVAQDIARREGNEAYQLTQMAGRQNVTLLPQDVASGPGIGRSTASAAQTPFGANTVRERASQTYESFKDRVATLAGSPRQSLNDVGAPIKDASARSAARAGQRAEETSGVVASQLGDAPDLTGAGQLIQRGATKWLRDTSEKAGQLYERISIPNTFNATLDSTRGALKDLTEGFKSNKALSTLWAENPRLKATLEAVTPDEAGKGGTVAWGDLKRFRSILGEIVGQPGLEADGNQIAALRKLYGAVSEDMRATAADAGGDALQQFNRANSYFGARANRVRDTIARVLGDDSNATAGEAFGQVESALKDAASGDAGFARRVLAQLPESDANAVRATIVNRARGGAAFDAKKLATTWGGISERAKSVLLPQAGLRSIMDDAAERAAASSHDPLEGKSAEQVYLALEKMAENKGDSARFAARMASLSPDEAQATRSLLVHRMGLANAGQQDAEGEAFSVAKFLTRWNSLSDEGRTVLFGNGELRDNMTEVAKLAERVKATERLAGHSNTGAINISDKTTLGLGSAALALVTGHPIIAAGLASPVAFQKISAEVLTSPRLLKWLARAPKKPNPAAQRAHIRALSSIARAEPAISSDVLSLQQRLTDAFGAAPARLAAQPSSKGGGVANGQAGQQQPTTNQTQP